MTQTFLTDSTFGFETFILSPSFINLTAFRLIDSNGQMAWDNIAVEQVSAVPEPSSLALFGIGACVAGLGAARRRRREKQQEATV